MAYGTLRGAFPKIEEPETIEQKRQRYERWIIDTHHELLATGKAGAKERDDAYQAVVNHPDHNPSMTHASLRHPIDAACWNCVNGDHDFGGSDRIAGCQKTDCALFAFRPYVDERGTPEKKKFSDEAATELGIGRNNVSAKAAAFPGSLRLAVRGYCHACCGGGDSLDPVREAAACRTVTCSLWRVRPEAKFPKQDHA